MSAARAGDPAVRVRVTVTFLRLEEPPAGPPDPWPAGATVMPRPDCTVSQYRALYDGVGEQYCWWLRRAMSDRELEALLRAPSLSLYVLRADGRDAGFHELDRSAFPVVNLNYFGLLPHAVGRGLGRRLLRHAIDVAFADGARAVTVNTCTADHPRALPNYLAAGFKPTRAVEEVWQVPTRLGLSIPPALRAG